MLLRMRSSWNLPSSCGSIKQCHMEIDNYCMAQQSHSYTDEREMKTEEEPCKNVHRIFIHNSWKGETAQTGVTNISVRCAGQRHMRMNLASAAERGLSLRELEHLAFTSSIFSFPYIYTLARFSYLRTN